MEKWASFLGPLHYQSMHFLPRLRLLILCTIVCGLAVVIPLQASGQTQTAKKAKVTISKASFTAAGAKTVKVTYSFPAADKSLKFVLSIKKGSAWTGVRSFKKKGSAGAKKLTVKQVFGSKAIKKGSYRLAVSAGSHKASVSFRVVTKTTIVTGDRPMNNDPPEISGTAEVGQILKSSEGDWNGSPTSFAYSWQRCSDDGEVCPNISGATGSSYKVVSADVGYRLGVRVVAKNAVGSAGADSTITEIVPLDATANPTISGSAVVGSTLSLASKGVWSGTPTSYAYSWQSCQSDHSDCQEVGTGETYKVVRDDVGYAIQVLVMATIEGVEGDAVSDLTSVVPLVNISAPLISGLPAQAGHQLTASPGTWNTDSGLNYAYSWQTCTSGYPSITDDNSDSALDVIASDVGHGLRVKVTAKVGESQAVAYSACTAAVIPAS